MLMAACALNLSASRAFSPARSFVGMHKNHRVLFWGKYQKSTNAQNVLRPLTALADGASFEEYRTKRASFEPNEPKVGPTALQTPGRAGMASKTWPNYYCAPDLERNGRDELLKPGALNAALESENSLFVLVWQGKNLFNPVSDGAYEAVLLSHVEAKSFTSDLRSIIIFLGKHKGKVVFGLDVSHLESVKVDAHGDAIFEQLRSLGGLLTDDHDAGLLVQESVA